MNVQRDKIDVILKLYEVARNEIHTRVTSRDNTLLLYLGTIAVVVGVIFQTNNTFLSLIIPFLALGVAPIISHHHFMIVGLSTYCATNLGNKLKGLGIDIDLWDNSKERREFAGKSIRQRYFGEIVIINIPPFFVILYNILKIDLINFHSIAAILFSFLCLILSIYFMTSSYSKRIKQLVHFNNNEILN